MTCAHCKDITVCAICGKGYGEAVRADGVSAAKHTPGPWVAQRCYVTRPEPNMQVMAQGGDLYIAAVEFSADPEHVSFVKDVEEMRANAFLIAAAPDMFKTLNDMDGWLANTGHAADHPWRFSIRAAIAKATGSGA